MKESNFFIFPTLFWALTTLFAPGLAEATTAAPQGPSIFESMVPMLFLFVGVYFMVLRPQMKKARDQAKLLSELKPGDEVTTTGGILGRVKSVAAEHVILDLGSTHIRILAEHILPASKLQVEKVKAKNGKYSSAPISSV